MSFVDICRVEVVGRCFGGSVGVYIFVVGFVFGWFGILVMVFVGVFWEVGGGRVRRFWYSSFVFMYKYFREYFRIVRVRKINLGNVDKE